MTPPLISFVVPVKDGAAHLPACLESIHAGSAGVPIEIVVADNGSTDESAAIALDAGAFVVDLPGLTVAQVRNRAAAATRGELIAFVDADHVLAPGWGASAAALFHDPAVAAAGSQYHAPPQGTWVQHMYDRLRRHHPGTRVVEWLPGGNLVIRRRIFDERGGFDSSLETCEDVDLCQRIRSNGGRILSTDALRSTHQGDPRTLTALFLGELWRGRDNLKVSLRGPMTLRSLPGLAFPVVNLLALAALPIGVVTLAVGGGRLVPQGLGLVTGALATLGALTAARAVALISQPGARGRGVRLAVEALLVAAVYDTARALSLVSRTGHAVRRGA